MSSLPRWEWPPWCLNFKSPNIEAPALQGSGPPTEIVINGAYGQHLEMAENTGVTVFLFNPDKWSLIEPLLVLVL